MKNLIPSPATDPYKKVCKYAVCNKQFTAKRTNQEYCSKDHRTKANNGQARAERELTNAFTLQLKKNLRILSRFWAVDKTDLSLRELEFQGFNLDVHTSLIRGIKPEIHIYNFKLEVINETTLKLYKK